MRNPCCLADGPGALPRRTDQYPDSEPYFARHYDRDVYVSLLQREDAEASPDALLKAALLKRAATNMARLARIKEDKPALHNLHQRGCVGEGLWKDALAAEKELQAEIIETMNEAESFTPGWGHLIHASGQEIAQNESTLKLLRSTEDRKREAGTSSRCLMHIITHRMRRVSTQVRHQVPLRGASSASSSTCRTRFFRHQTGQHVL